MEKGSNGGAEPEVSARWGRCCEGVVGRGRGRGWLQHVRGWDEETRGSRVCKVEERSLWDQLRYIENKRNTLKLLEAVLRCRY